MAASVLVSVDNASGSGTVIHAGTDRLMIVLTCRHVVSGSRRSLRVRLADGGSYEAVFLGADDRADLAAIAFYTRSGHNVPSATLAREQPQAGTGVWQIGYPGGRGPVARQGSLRGRVGVTSHGIAVLATSFTVADGDSGSGLFDARNHALIGVVWGSSPEGAAATGIEDIHRFLEEKCKKWLGGSRAPPTPAPVPEIARLRAEVESLRRELAEWKARPGAPGPAGPKGEKGDPGPSGPPGSPGAPGDAAAFRQEIALLRDQVRGLEQKLSNLSGSIRVRVEPVSK